MKKEEPSLNYDKIRERIEKEKKKYKRGEWSKLLGISSATISNIHGKTRQKPSFEYVASAARLIGKPIEYFLYGPEYKEYLGITDESIEKYKTEAQFILIPQAKPHLSKDGSIIIDEDAQNAQLFNSEMLSEVATDIKNLILMKAQGDSMYPTFNDGDILLIDTGRKELRGSNIYAFNIGDDVVQIKRIEPRGEIVRVINDNRQVYEPYDLNIKDIQIIGQVIWIGRILARE